jgi:hypothetical protein
LALLNSDFALARAEAFARRLLAETDGSTAALIDRAWRLAVGRQPTAHETALAAEFLESQRDQYTHPDTGAEAHRWAATDFCQMLLASSPFLYLE